MIDMKINLVTEYMLIMYVESPDSVWLYLKGKGSVCHVYGSQQLVLHIINMVNTKIISWYGTLGHDFISN